MDPQAPVKQTPDSNAGALAALHSPWTGVIIALLFIIIAVVAVVVIRRDKKKSGFCGGGCGGGRERFGWADWAENTERENFATSGCSSDDVDDPLDGLEVYRQHWHHGGSSHFCGGGSHAGAAEAEADAAMALREGFSPDAPGACSQKFSQAARAELDALRVAAGL